MRLRSVGKARLLVIAVLCVVAGAASSGVFAEVSARFSDPDRVAAFLDSNPRFAVEPLEVLMTYEVAS